MLSLTSMVNNPAHQPVVANNNAGSRAQKTFHRTLTTIPGRTPMSMAASKIGSRHTVASRTETFNSTGLVVRAAAPQGNYENFASKLGDKPNLAIDSVGNERSNILNPPST